MIGLSFTESIIDLTFAVPRSITFGEDAPSGLCKNTELANGLLAL